MKFHTTLEAAGKTATGIVVPPEVVESLGQGKRPPVTVTINDFAYRSTVAVMGGRYMIAVSAENRAGAGIAAGDEIDVELELDNEPRVVTVPPDFAEALAGDSAAKEKFESLSYSQQLQHVLAIDAAKSPETRQRRIDGALAKTDRRMSVGGLLLTPGAGASRDQRTLVALEHAVNPLPCARIDFPYRQAGRRIPDPAPVAIAHLIREAAAFTESTRIAPDQLVLGGRSYGGRMCSMAVAEGLPAAGLVLLSYPLHPPGRPEKLRVEHFSRLTVPVLFISGGSDPFGSPAEFDSYVSAIPGPVTQVWLPGGHDPRPTADKTIIEAVKSWLATI